MSKDARKDKMPILGKEGGLRTSDEYEDISIDPGSGELGGLSYCIKVSKIREIIYCAECLCARKTYMAWRNMIYREGYAETMIGETRRNLATSELEPVGRFFRNTFYGASRKYKLTIQSAMGGTLSGSLLTVELLHKATSFGRQGGKHSNKGEPGSEKQNQTNVSKIKRIPV